MSLTAIQSAIAQADLDAWGSLSGIGAEILEGGDIQAFGRMTHGAPVDAVSSGYFGTTTGTFRLVYPFGEQATVVTGSVSITDESTGTTRRFEAGDSWFVEKGTSTLWTVPPGGFVKHYFGLS